jgi:hypothetical protein
MPLRDPKTRRILRKELDRLWLLGRSLVAGWAVVDGRIALLLLPNARLPEIESFGEDLIGRGPRRLSPSAFNAAARRFHLEPVLLERPHVGDPPPHGEALIEAMLLPYGIALTESRAIALLDIVGFSRAPRLEQAARLNSLAYSIAIAQRRCRQLGIDVDLARSTTGDGFYLWNRKVGVAADIELCCLVLLALADNRLAAGAGGVAPRLRSAISRGSHFSFFQPEGDSERTTEFIVGEATIACARMVAAAQPRQVLVGAPDRGELALAAGMQARLDAVGDIATAGTTIRRIGVWLSGGAEPRRNLYAGKHGLEYPACNLRATLLCDDGGVVGLGLASAAARPRGDVAPPSARHSATVSPPST